MPLAKGKAFYVLFIQGIVVSGIAAVHGAAAVVDAPDFKGIAMANRADNRIVAPEVAGPRTAADPFSLSPPGRYCPKLAQLLIVLFRFFR